MALLLERHFDQAELGIGHHHTRREQLATPSNDRVTWLWFGRCGCDGRDEAIIDNDGQPRLFSSGRLDDDVLDVKATGETKPQQHQTGLPAEGWGVNDCARICHATANQGHEPSLCGWFGFVGILAWL
jgi:hypothetical protein